MIHLCPPAVSSADVIGADGIHRILDFISSELLPYGPYACSICSFTAKDKGWEDRDVLTIHLPSHPHPTTRDPRKHLGVQGHRSLTRCTYFWNVLFHRRDSLLGAKNVGSVLVNSAATHIPKNISQQLFSPSPAGIKHERGEARKGGLWTSGKDHKYFTTFSFTVGGK